MLADNVAHYLRPNTRGPNLTLGRLANFIRGLAVGGFNWNSVEVCTGAVQATGTITFTDQPVADETLIVGGITFTGKASGATTDEWDITSGGTAAADAAGNAASVAALINNHATLGACMTAVQVLGVVTVTIDVPGVIGNAVTIAEGSGGMTNCTVSSFASGSHGTLTTLAV